MKRKVLAASVAMAVCTSTFAFAGAEMAKDHAHAAEHRTTYFRHHSTFDVTRNPGSEVAEIVDVTGDNKLLVYTDSPGNQLGFVNIADARFPKPAGTVALGGEPTSVAVVGDYALAGVNTSTIDAVECVDPGDDGVFETPDDEIEEIEFISDWSGRLVVVDIPSRTIVHEISMPGQPDSVAVSPDGKYAAVVIENERNEDVGDGLIPQGGVTVDLDPTLGCDLVATGSPVPGSLVIVDLDGMPGAWTTRDVRLAGRPGMFAADDPEPEYVDIDNANHAIVSLQENNHIAIVRLDNGNVIRHFPAGEVDLMDVDTIEDDLITLDSNITKRREPDSVTGVDWGLFATANEGDYEDGDGEEGGSRGFTIFSKKTGAPVYESHESFEHLLVSAGHYNEGRSENKGVEPEAVEYARYGRDRLLFVGSERSNAVGVYELFGDQPRLLQVLPTGIGPEGLKAIPGRDLFVASTETDVFDDGIPTMINIYKRKPAPANYPQIASSADENGLPIPWVALSDLVGDPSDWKTLYAVSDSFLAKGFVYTIDVSGKPAQIVDRLEIDSADELDLEGIAVGPDGSFWLGSEGQTEGGRENLVLKVDPDTGMVLDRIELPADMIDARRGNGIEGIAVTGLPGEELVYVTIQRAWPDEGDTDEVNTKIGRYDVATGAWGFVHYPLEPEGDGGWIGLSGITAMPDGSFWVIERDKGWGDSTPPNAELKALFRVELADADFRPYVQPEPGGEADLVTIDKSLVRNLVDDIAANSVWTAEKLEGFAVTAAGRLFAVTDNDGVDDAPGETVFLRLGGFDDFE